jgi:hypothetical protein
MHKPYLMDRIQHITPLLLFLSLFIISYACGHLWCAFSFFAFINPYNWQVSTNLINQQHLFTDLQPAVLPNRFRMIIRCTEYVPEWFLSSRYNRAA